MMIHDDTEDAEDTCDFHLLPSGKHTKNCGKSPCY